MSGQLNSSQLQPQKRYQHPVVIDHLASNFVLGTLNEIVRRRTEKLSRFPEYKALAERIVYWENKLAPLNDEIPELVPKPQVWEALESAIEPTTRQSVQDDSASSGWFAGLLGTFGIQKWVTAFSLIFAIVLGVNHLQKPEDLGSLSYVAVMTDENQTPQVVAATYGDSQTLMLDILTLPDIDSEESFELWVTSKTDKQTRSLGVIPTGTDSFSRELTVAEWRLIKDSDSLLITVEELGGSSIGSPMGDTISKGLCIRLSAWQET